MQQGDAPVGFDGDGLAGRRVDRIPMDVCREPAQSETAFGERWNVGAAAVDAGHLLLSARRAAPSFLGIALSGGTILEMLLFVFLEEEAGRSVTGMRCREAACAPRTTAGRWVKDMVSSGVLTREPHPSDRRQTVVSLREDVRSSIRGWLSDAAMHLDGRIRRSAGIQGGMTVPRPDDRVVDAEMEAVRQTGIAP